MTAGKNLLVGITMPLAVLLITTISNGHPLSDPPQPREIRVTVGANQFSPSTIRVSKGERVRLELRSEQDHPGRGDSSYRVNSRQGRSLCILVRRLRNRSPRDPRRAGR